MSEYESLKQELADLKQRMIQLEQSTVADFEPIAQPQILELAEIQTATSGRSGIAPAAETAQQSEVLMEIERSRVITSVIERIRQTLDIPTIFRATTHEVRHILHCDRVALYQYNADWGGDFVYESVGVGWTPLVFDDDRKTVWNDTYLQENWGGRYRHESAYVVHNIHQSYLSPCHLESLERFQAKAYCVVPVFMGERLWGLMGAYQNSGSRQWRSGEVSLLVQIGKQLGVALQHVETVKQLKSQSERLEQALEREQTITEIIDKIRRSFDINTIFQTTVQEALHLLKADRVAVYEFNPDWSGQFVVEAITEGWRALMEPLPEDADHYRNVTDCSVKLLAAPKITDTHLQETLGGQYTRGEVFRVANNIYHAELSPCYIRLLETFQARAYVVVALYRGKKLWGLLAAYQNAAPRQWRESDVKFLVQIGSHLGIAVQQAELLSLAEQRSTALQTTLENQLRQRADELAREAEQERAIAKVIDKIRRTLNIETIFETTATEVRQLLNADRVAMYRFTPGSGCRVGEFVSEAALPIFGSTIATEITDYCFAEQRAGQYQQGQVWAVDDVYRSNLDDCHIQMFARFQIRANLVAPLLKGNELWGLLCVHQCVAPRQWQSQEIEFVTQIAAQLGVALQQTEFLTQVQRQSAELQQAKEAADAASKAKGDFLANMSHELRTPLNAILGFAQLMTRDVSLNSEQKGYLEIIGHSGEHLLALINDVLEMSKIEAGQMTVNEVDFDLYRLLDSLEEMLELKAASKQLQLIFDRPPNIPQFIHADESKLRQVLINLLGNAIKFTQTGSVTLKIHAADPAPRLRFEVADTGAGIAPHELTRLFDAFVQTEAGRNSQEGTGLGLPISRKFVQLMGGEITVSSTVGRGSIFEFEISIAPAIAAAAQVPARRVLGLEAGQPVYRILVAEDKWANRQVLVKLLQSIGFEVREAENGQEAIDLCQSWLPDLIWMDMRMPILDGYEATKTIKSRPNPPIVLALTANAFEEERMLALSIGCDDFIRKPFQEEVILEKMAEHLGVRYVYGDRTTLEEASLHSPEPEPSPMMPLDAVPAPSVNPLKILLAEDNALNQMLALQMLQVLGHVADVAVNGQEVLQTLRRQPYDVVLMDMKMPVMDGLAATRQICQEWTADRRPRIIAMTAGALQSDYDKCIAAGMDDYLSKPIRMPVLSQALSQCQPHSQIEAPVPATLDAEALQNLRDLERQGAADLLEQLIQNYLQVSPTLLQEIQSAIDQSQPEVLELAAHSLKSMSATLGATALSEICGTLEAMGETRTLPAPAAVKQLETEMCRVEAALAIERQRQL